MKNKTPNGVVDMKSASQTITKTIIVSMLLLSGKVSIANENSAKEQKSSTNESNSTKPNIEGGCVPMPKCANENNMSHSEMDVAWFEKILKLLSESEKKSNEDDT
ncbi:MAG: hypothetical protein OQJ89_04600 [Kangiellaceae bacterium]|nr:hypothetical protein [Kangiellaceae bacterium]MCW9016223.1 hypothetical protein [Kangiellaceae bacterium]